MQDSKVRSTGERSQASDLQGLSYLVQVTEANYCGRIGKGSTVCVDKPNCRVAAHARNREELVSATGVYIQNPDRAGTVIGAPRIPLEVEKKYKALLERFKMGAPQTVLGGVLHMINELEKTGLSEEEKYQELADFLECLDTFRKSDGSIDEAAAMVSPRKSGGMISGLKRDSDSIEEELQDDADATAKYEKRVRKDIHDLDRTTASYRLLSGVVGSQNPGEPPLTTSVRVLRDEVKELSEGIGEVTGEVAQVVKSTQDIKDMFIAQERTSVSQEGRLHSLEAVTRGQRTDLDALVQNFGAVINYLENLPRTREGEAPVEVEAIVARLKEIEGKLGDGQGRCEYSLQGRLYEFANQGELEQFCSELKTDTPHVMCFDPLVVLGRLGNHSVSVEDIERSEVHSVKVHRPANYTSLICAYKSVYPHILTGKSVSNQTNSRSVFHQIDTYPKFDKGNGFEGLCPHIIKNTRLVRKTIETEIREQLRDLHKHRDLALFLLHSSCEFIEKLLEFASKMRKIAQPWLRRRTLHRGRGKGGVGLVPTHAHCHLRHTVDHSG